MTTDLHDHKVKGAAELLNTSPAQVRKLCPQWEAEGKAYKLSDKDKAEWRIPHSTIQEHKRRRLAGEPVTKKKLTSSERERLLNA